MDMFRFHGQPAVHMHMWDLADYDAGLVKRCPGCWDSMYGNVRNDCKVCFGTGYVSTENNTQGNFIDIRGRIVTGDPGTHLVAPRYGGFGPRTLTWIIEPDRAQDVFKLTQQGALVKVQNADAYAPWFPLMGDNDLLINVNVDRGYNILGESLRLQLKMVTPQSLRGWGRRQRSLRESEYLIGQQFEVNQIQQGTILTEVPVDPDDWTP